MKSNARKRIVALLLLACMLFAFSGEAFAATVKVKSLKITNGNVSIRVGESVTLKTTITPSNATNKGVTWSTSNKSVATVSSSGVVKGLKGGTVTITATSKDNKKIKANCKITVDSYIPVKSLTITNGGYVTFLRGEKITLKTKVTPSNATNKGVTWSSSNPLVAKVSSSGVVTSANDLPGFDGYVTITATSKDNKKIVASCTVFVGDAYQYRVVKVKDLDATYTKAPIYDVAGEPGHKLSIKKTKEVARTYSVTVNVSLKAINTAIGWKNDKTDKVSITSSDEWTVPEKHEGKKVKEAILEAYGKLDRVEYKIQRRAYRIDIPVRYGRWVDWKTGCIAEKASERGIKFKSRYIYK